MRCRSSRVASYERLLGVSGIGGGLAYHGADAFLTAARRGRIVPRERRTARPSTRRLSMQRIVEHVIPPKLGFGLVVKTGQTLRITDLEGKALHVQFADPLRPEARRRIRPARQAHRR